MPTLSLIGTPAGPRYFLDGSELRSGDPIEICGGEGQPSGRGVFVWSGDTRNAPWIRCPTWAGAIPEGADVRHIAEVAVLESDTGYIPPNQRAMAEWERRTKER